MKIVIIYSTSCSKPVPTKLKLLSSSEHNIQDWLVHFCLKVKILLNACFARFPFLSNIFYWTVQLLMYVENSFMKWTHLKSFFLV